MDRSGKSNLKLSVEYEGVLQNQARALLTQELLKYFLFQLCQIPSNYEAVNKGGLKVSDNANLSKRSHRKDFSIHLFPQVILLSMCVIAVSVFCRLGRKFRQ